MSSYLSHLECTICGAEYPANRLSGVSPCCGKVLYARYNLARIRAEVTATVSWSERPTCGGSPNCFPSMTPDNIVSLGEGGTPLDRGKEPGRKAWRQLICTSRRRA